MPTFWSMHFCSKPRAISTVLLALLGPFVLQRACADIVVSAPVFHAGLKAANDAATADHSLVMIVFSASWCGPCKQLKAKTLSSREFADQAGTLHVVDIDVDGDANTAREYDVQAVPTLVILTPDNKIVSRREGFMDTADLLLWLRESRERAKEGKWEGNAPGTKLAQFVAGRTADELGTNDLARLVELLGEPGPAEREAVAKLLADKREQAMPPLIDALTNSYLGIRIAAAEVLHKLAPESLSVDPWQAPSELAETLDSLREWWATTGKLSTKRHEPIADRATAVSISGALDSLRGNDPVRRTEAMSTLVGFGVTALPAVREAIKSSEKAGDQRSLTLLEDVRWAILIPDDVDQRVGGVRNVLARGAGPDRHGAAGRLGKAGRPAIPALAELVEDADPLVVESAVRALSKIGGNDSIPAMAALLKVADSNLRMSAAQALGHTMNKAAIPELLTVLEDPNEVVACAALSALDEINGERNYAPTRLPQPPELIQALKRCLADPRWRVRAAAAELAGKLGASELVGELNSLLSDSDGFVVKTSLEALQKINAAPGPQKLLAIVRDHPDLRAETVEVMVTRGTDESVKTITELYNSSAIEARIAIVLSLGASSRPGQDQETNSWQPLLSQAAAESDPRLRRVAAQILSTQPPEIAGSVVGPLLTDKDNETRSAAAAVVLGIVGRERQVLTSSHGTSISEFVSLADAENLFGASRIRPGTTNAPAATTEQISSWHASLQQTATNLSDLLTVAALYVTGPTNANLQQLQGALEHTDRTGLDRFSRSAAAAAIIPRLPWPEGKPIVERFCLSPSLFLKMITYAHRGNQGLRDYLFEPERFRASVDPASAEDLGVNLQRLLGPQQRGWTFSSNNPRTEAVVKALLDATNAAWRAAAVYSLGSLEYSSVQGSVEHALSDSNAWVRAAAVSAVIRTVKDRPTAERVLGPVLRDPNRKVVDLAAIGLLEPETRTAAGLDYLSGNFEFEKIHVWSSFFDPTVGQRPLAVLKANPPFLETLRERLANVSPEEAALPALLLAQYGDFNGLDHVLKSPIGSQTETEGLILAAIGLSRNARYVPYVKQMAASAKEEQDFRRLLPALKGITGAEARELRLEINRRIRDGTE